MRYNIISYLIGDGIRNIAKNKKSTISAIAIMVITMLTVGLCFVIGENVNVMLTKMEEDLPVEVYMDDNITVSEREKLEEEIRNLEYVNPNITYVSKDEAYQNAVKKLGSDSIMLVGYSEKEHPFPQSFIIRFTQLDKVKEITQQIEGFDNVIGTSGKDDRLIGALMSFKKHVNIIILVLGGVLVVFSLVIIGNTIKLTVHARRKEISIMKYVGATNNFIRAPFVVEGIVMGIIASCISLLILAGFYVWLRSFLMGHGLENWLSGLGLTSGIELLEFNQLFQNVSIIFLVLGTGIGVIGSVLSMKKYLKV